MKSSSFAAQTSGSRSSSSSPKSMPGIGRWAFWRCLFGVFVDIKDFLGGSGQDQEWIVTTGAV